MSSFLFSYQEIYRNVLDKYAGNVFPSLSLYHTSSNISVKNFIDMISFFTSWA